MGIRLCMVGACPESNCNLTTRYCIFSLDTTRDSPQNSGNFSDGVFGSGTDTGKIGIVPQGGMSAIFAGLDCAMH
jgi:hypothetical protein